MSVFQCVKKRNVKLFLALVARITVLTVFKHHKCSLGNKQWNIRVTIAENMPLYTYPYTENCYDESMNSISCCIRWK